MLKQHELQQAILHGHQSVDEEVISDFCDGEFIRNHEACKNHETLQLALYFDELEVSNPLGSRRGKHKLGEILVYNKVCWQLVM